MRLYSLFFILVWLLTACSPPAETTGAQVTPPLRVSSSPTQFDLGKCVDARQPTPDPQEISLFPPVGDQDHILGAADAYVTILVYSDFQCAACASLAPLLRSFVEKYPNDVRIVFRHYPLVSIHDKATLSAQFAQAASLQGKFWQMHDFLFAAQTEWLDQKPNDFQKWVIEHSTELGLDKSRLESDLTSPSIVSFVQTAWIDGQKIKLPGTPVILINGEIIRWQVNLLSQLESLVKLAMLPQKQFDICPPVIIDQKNKYTALLTTSKGLVTIKLFADRTPNTVNNFIFLAKKGWYANSPFYRVVSGVIAQTGDPTGTGFGSPGYFIHNEKSTMLYDRAGMVGMVNSGPDTNGSQFFITLAPDAVLNNKYTLFGEVISGMDVLSLLTPVSTDNLYGQNNLIQPDALISVSIEEK
jgi:cyclophilin family peptidyl-prolyl cis-trans isomerase/protein-disulfide isomerase